MVNELSVIDVYPGSVAAPPSGQDVIIVHRVAICAFEERAEEEAGQIPPMPEDAKRDYLVQFMADLILVSKDAEAKKVGDAAAFKRRLEFERRKILMSTLLQTVGKSALTRRFTDQLTADAEAVVFFGRCYERESVPYKAVDDVVDAISRYLGMLETVDVERLLPDDAHLLGQRLPQRLPARRLRLRHLFDPGRDPPRACGEAS